MKTDAELTDRLRHELSIDGNRSAQYYKWYLGEILYRGNPLSFGNLTAWEKKAALRVQHWATKDDSVFVTPMGQRDIEEKTKQAHDKAVSLGVGHLC